MTKGEFKAGLETDGYAEIEELELDPGPRKGWHRHHFKIRGLVLSGEFIVMQGEGPLSYCPGQIFEVAARELHDESIGSDGARVLIGRKFP